MFHLVYADTPYFPCSFLPCARVFYFVSRPQFFVRTADVTGSVKLPDGTEMVMPGDTVSLTIDVSFFFFFSRFISLFLFVLPVCALKRTGRLLRVPWTALSDASSALCSSCALLKAVPSFVVCSSVSSR